MATLLSIIALAIGLYLVVRPASVVRTFMKLFNRIDTLHPPGPVFSVIVFIIGAILVVIGAINLFR